MDEKIIEAMKAEAPLNWDKANNLADQFGIKARAIVASATKQGIEYRKKQRVSKSGAPVVRKTDLVARIEQGLAFDSGALDGLDKASKAVLEKLAGALED